LRERMFEQSTSNRDGDKEESFKSNHWNIAFELELIYSNYSKSNH